MVVAKMTEDAQTKFDEICQLLVAAGYFKARIPALSPFDKVAGGIVWCMTAASVDVDVAFQENATIGQKIRIGESIERTLKSMKGSVPLQAHQLQGLDFDAIFPLVQWLVKQVYGCREEIGEAMRRLSLLQFEAHCRSQSATETVSTPLSGQALRSRYAPKRLYRLKKSGDNTSARLHAQHVLLEYGLKTLSIGDGSTAQQAFGPPPPHHHL